MHPRVKQEKNSKECLYKIVGTQKVELKKVLTRVSKTGSRTD